MRRKMRIRRFHGRRFEIGKTEKSEKPSIGHAKLIDIPPGYTFIAVEIGNSLVWSETNMLMDMEGKKKDEM